MVLLDDNIVQQKGHGWLDSRLLSHACATAHRSTVADENQSTGARHGMRVMTRSGRQRLKRRGFRRPEMNVETRRREDAGP